MIRIGLLAMLLLVAGAAGQYTDTARDAPDGLDLLAVDWSEPGRTVVTLSAPLPEDAGLTAILFVGTQGSNEPAKAIAYHIGPEGARTLDTTDGTQQQVQIARDGDAVVIMDGPDENDRGACHFIVARTVTYHEGGQQAADVIGWHNEDIGTAWNNGRACSEGQPVDAVIEREPQASIPAPAILAVLAGLFLLRRTQR